MTTAQIQSTIKRLNERAAEMDRQAAAGKIPQSAADNYRAALQELGKGYLTKSGNISHGKKAAENIDIDDLKRMEQRATAAQVRQRTREGARQEYGEDVTEEEYEEYMEDIDYVNEAMSDDPSEAYDAYAAAFTGKPGRKSYGALRAAIEAYRGSVSKPRVFSADRLFT
jgi:hypothetical protein